MALEKHRVCQQRDGCPYGRIEALEMTDLNDPLVLVGNRLQFLSFFIIDGKRFFNKQVNSGQHQIAGSFEMRNCGDGYRGSVNGTAGQQITDRTIVLSRKLLCYLSAAISICIDNACQFDWVAFLLKLVIDACVVTSEGAYAYHGNSDLF